MFGALADRSHARHGFPRRRGLPLDHAAVARSSASTSSGRAPAKSSCDGVGLHGLARAGRAARHGQRGHRHAALHGAAERAAVRFRAGRRRVADAPADGARRQAAARAWVRRIETHDGKPPVRISRRRDRCSGIRYEMPVASAQVKSAVLLAGLYADGRNDGGRARRHARSHRAHAAELRLRGPGARRRRHARAAARAAGGARFDVPGDISSAAFFLVAACLGAREPFTIRDVGVNPTRTGILEMLALMGADLRLINHRTCGHGAGGRHRGAPVAAARVRAFPSGWCRSRSTSSRRSSSRPPAPRARPS